MGARLEDSLSARVSHVFASSSDSLLQILNVDQLCRFTGVSLVAFSVNLNHTFQVGFWEAFVLVSYIR